ncbi:ATP-dependent DNA ligase [Actinomadura keratinilytica]
MARIPPGMQYEAKWDGFRALVFRDGPELELGSRTGKTLTRYFPELVAALLERLPERCVVDGEIVMARDGRLDFELLSERIHPAASRVRMLAEKNPASFIAFDLLALGDEDLTARPLTERRALLEEELGEATPPLHVAPATRDPELAEWWFDQFEGAGLDGVVAKPLNLGYRPNERVMYKIKHGRTADCVVVELPHPPGWHRRGLPAAGPLRRRGHPPARRRLRRLHRPRRTELVAELEPLRLESVADHPWAAWGEAAAHEEARLPGAPSRWSGTKDLSWVPLRPERVCEVGYDHMEGTRFRHTTQFKRWRPDRTPESCTYAQLAEPVRYDLGAVLGESG